MPGIEVDFQEEKGRFFLVTALFLSEMNIATYICRLEHYAFAGRKWSEYNETNSYTRKRTLCSAAIGDQR
jgi:hypothetical protein